MGDQEVEAGYLLLVAIMESNLILVIFEASQAAVVEYLMGLMLKKMVDLEVFELVLMAASLGVEKAVELMVIVKVGLGVLGEQQGYLAFLVKLVVLVHLAGLALVVVFAT